MSLNGVGAIIGIGEIPPQRSISDQTTLGLIARAARAALIDSGLNLDQIDGLIVGTHVGETPQHVPGTVSEYLGLTPGYAGSCDLGGASGAGMIWRAAAAIKSGMATHVLCVLGNTREKGLLAKASNRNPIREFDVPYGMSGANSSYALFATRHMAEFGTTAEQLAQIAVNERNNAQLNPDAVFFGQKLTVADVLASPMISSPIHLLEAVMPCAGAAAVIVTSLKYAKTQEKPYVHLLGAGEMVTHRAASQAKSFTQGPLRLATKKAYDMANISVSDIGMFSLYDCYTIMVGMTLEDVGVCEQGTFGDFVMKNNFSHDSQFPINTHGGQLGAGQADLAGGMGHVIEAVRQLRGSANGRQISNLNYALVTGNGGTVSESVALVLGKNYE